MSGYGRESGKQHLEEYLNVKASGSSGLSASLWHPMRATACGVALIIFGGLAFGCAPQMGAVSFSWYCRDVGPQPCRSLRRRSPRSARSCGMRADTGCREDVRLSTARSSCPRSALHGGALADPVIVVRSAPACRTCPWRGRRRDRSAGWIFRAAGFGPARSGLSVSRSIRTLSEASGLALVYAGRLSLRSRGARFSIEAFCKQSEPVTYSRVDFRGRHEFSQLCFHRANPVPTGSSIGS